MESDSDRYTRLSKFTNAGLILKFRDPKTPPDDKKTIEELLTEQSVDIDTIDLVDEKAGMPGSRWYLWIFAGAGYGLFLRLLFGLLPNAFTANGVMSAGFMIGAPVVAGALSVAALPERKRTLPNAFFIPWAAVALMLAGSALTLLEGSICILMMAPIFLVFGSVGGILMYAIQAISDRRGTHVSAFALLPALLLVGESFVDVRGEHLQISQSIIIDAAPQRVWREILDARDIRPHELPFSITHAIGVPRPVEGVNRLTEDGEVRYSVWERGVQFRGIVRERREHESIHWEYAFDSHSFPPGSMDDHVAIGGKFFNLKDTRFELREIRPGQTELLLTARYRVSSTINFYAVPAATVLGHDFVHTILGLYKFRSES